MLSEQSYFDLFSLPKTFFINPDHLKNIYHKLSKLYHPDRTKSNVEFEKITSAYTTLKDDYSRAKYMYKKPMNSVSPDFLKEILEYEELIQTNNDLERIKNQLEIKIDECKKYYNKGEFLSKWRYYDRLINLINKKL